MRGHQGWQPRGRERVKTVRNYVDGDWVDPKAERFQSYNARHRSAVRLCAGQRRCRRGCGGASGPPGLRPRRLAMAQRFGARRCAAGLRRRPGRPRPRDQRADRLEMGKPVRVNMAREIHGAVDKLRFFAGAARMLEGQITAVTAPEVWDMTLPEPVGVAALIIPWNDPVDLAVRKLGAAFAAGCTTVVKSSEVTPASTAALIEVAHETRGLSPRRDQSGAWTGRSDRRGAGRPSRRRQDLLHRQHGDRHPDHGAGGQAPRESLARMRRQVSGADHARRRPGALPRCRDLRRLHVCGAILHRLHAARRPQVAL